MLTILRRLFRPLAYKMPDSVRSLPVPNIRYMVAARSLTVCKPLY